MPPAPPPTWRSSRRASIAAPTCGPTTRRSTSWSTSARSRTSPPTRCPASPTSCCRCCPGCASTPARAAAAAASSSGSTRAPGSATSPSTSRWRCSRSSATTSVAARPARSRAHEGRYNIVYGYVDEQVGIAAARLAVRLVNHLVEADPEFDWDKELEAFILRAERTAFGPSTQAILDEAVSRDIPWIRLNQHSLVQLGQGVHQKRIRATMTSATSAIAVDVASDKDLTTRLLGAAGLPVPKQESVRTADQAVTVARADRLPRRGQAARRQPRPRRLPRPAERRRRTRGVPDRQGPVPRAAG